MKVLQLYNQTRGPTGGEEIVVRNTIALLKDKGLDLDLWMPTSRGLDKHVWGKAKAFFSGIYSLSAYRRLRRRLRENRPDIVHAHNLYPLLSPSVLVACRHEGIPVVLTLHNHSMTCPNWHHLRRGVVCERCLHGREYWCALTNCTGQFFKSFNYTLRSTVARWGGFFHKHVDVIIALTHSAKTRLIGAGFESHRIVVLPNRVSLEGRPTDPAQGTYGAYLGRISPEKGVDTLLEAATQTNLPLHIGGDTSLMPHLVASAPAHVQFLGSLDRDQVHAFYKNARFVVVPSRCFEMCPLVIGEAMQNGLPVIASNIGGLPEVVEDGVTGLLFEPGNAQDLVSKMEQLWDDPQRARAMGQAGFRKAQQEYGEETYYRQLLAVYRRAIQANSQQSQRNDPAAKLGKVNAPLENIGR